MSEAKKTPAEGGEQLMELVKLFEGFTQASTDFAQSYRALEQRIARLSSQLEEQARLLQRTEGFLSSVLTTVPVGIIVVDMDGQIMLFNREAERLTGLKAREVIGGAYGDFFPYDVTEPDSAVFTLTQGTLIDAREKILAVQGGANIPVRFSTVWVYGEDGQQSGVMEVFEDLRTLKEMQERMQRSANLAALGEMAAQVAHELRNPLAGVQGFAQFLIEDITEDHPARTIAEKIITGVKDIEQIASRLLEFTRPLRPALQEVNLHTILTEEVELLRAELQERGSDVTLRLTLPEEEIPVQGDGSLIKQAVLNLLKNSLEACEDGGEIRASLSWDLMRNRVRITVEDDGVGITPENLDKIFNPFFTTRTKGTGLGLSMVKKIVDVHGGDILVRSNEGKGARFVMELPITRIE
ncbi:MAG TPA: PAS domain S-box protein [Bacteroidetes bacterium]|nr:PAS domain S-box protein [Bacteroidota bacterium]